MDTSQRLFDNTGDQLDVGVWWEVSIGDRHVLHYEVNPITVDPFCPVCRQLGSEPE